MIIKNGDSNLQITKTPGDFQEMHLSLYIDAVSLQSKGQKKRVFKNFVRKLTQEVDFIIAGDISIEITWYTKERLRYEAPNFLDIDNIVKVTIDSLVGPDGLIIDDCIIQHFSCTWMDTYDKEHIEVIIKYDQVLCYSKKDLCFFHLGQNLYYGLYTISPKFLLESLLERYNFKKKIMEETGDYLRSNEIMPVQRLFHKNKLKDFKLMEYEDFD